MKYVFVACGAARHLDLLHRSISMLKKYSDKPIIVVTDLKRNEKPIQHTEVLHIDTPAHFSHAEAAIYLKTGLGNWLSLSNEDIFCYLDTDVFAVSEAVDSIFSYFVPPVTFAKDHGDLYHFSPEAIYHPEAERQIANTRLLTKLFRKALELDQALKLKYATAVRQIEAIKKEFHQKRPLYSLSANEATLPPQKIKILASQLAFKVVKRTYQLLSLLAGTSAKDREKRFENIHQRLFKTPFDFKTYAQIQAGLHFEEQSETWYNQAGEMVFKENFVQDYIASNSSFVWDETTQLWRDQSGNPITWPGSDQLREQIKVDFETEITHAHWTHWNGGIFLFSQTSLPFLQQWHDWALQTFPNPKWKTRDQGTLAAVVWNRHLQEHPTLPLEFNFIADYHLEKYQYLGGFKFKTAEKKVIQPVLLHIFHEAGNSSWPLWKDIELLTAEA